MVRIVVMLTVLAVAGCGMTPPEDATCYVDTYTRHDNDIRPVRLVATSNGRWCSFGWQIENGVPPEPLVGGRVLTAPASGSARVVDIAGKTRVEYLAPLAYVGPDAFAVELGRQKMVLNVVVEVHAPAAGSPAVQPKAAAAVRPPPAATGNPPAVQPISQPIGFRCPQQQSVQTFTDGGAITWLGTAPGAPDICIGRNRAGAAVERVRGIWSVDTYWPDSIPVVRDAMTRLTTEMPGTDVSFTVTGHRRLKDDPRPGTWTHTVRVLGVEDVVMQGGSFATVVIEDTQTAPSTGAYLARELRWVDKATGVVVKAAYDQANPTKHTRWETTSLKPPG